jgi:hypothetical protein
MPQSVLAPKRRDMPNDLKMGLDKDQLTNIVAHNLSQSLWAEEDDRHEPMLETGCLTWLVVALVLLWLI